jgi:hypothetical protein
MPPAGFRAATVGKSDGAAELQGVTSTHNVRTAVLSRIYMDDAAPVDCRAGWF